MWNMIWPIALVVTANCFYNICTKSTPERSNAFLSLAITYLVAALISAILFLRGKDHDNIVTELKALNWTSVILGIAVVALEFGYISMYRAGWKVGMGSLVANICLACVLVVIGVLLYEESISVKQVIGMLICGIGLVMVSK